MVRILLALFVACLAALVAALVYLPWWGFLLVLLGVFLALMGVARLLTGRLGTMLFSIPFRAKGAVLRRAGVEVHSVEAVAAPEGVGDDEGGDDDDGAPRDHYRIDATITPRPGPGPFQFWEPGELMLVPADARVALDDMPEGAGLTSIEIDSDGAFGPDEGMKYHGALRLRFAVAVPRGWSRKVAFCYYFSKFGTVTLPPPARGDGAGRPAADHERRGGAESARS